MTVYQATKWPQVEAIAALRSVCIQPNASNWLRAKETWDVHQKADEIRYYLRDPDPIPPQPKDAGQKGGYVRVLRVSQSIALRPTWVADYVLPPQTALVLEVAALLDGTLLVKRWASQGDVDWPMITARWPRLDDYPYHFSNSTECEWLVVPA